MKRMKDPGSAHAGLSDWYWQRFSAIALALLLPLPFFLLVAVYSGGVDQQGLLDIIDNFGSRLLHTILIFALLMHAYFGLKVIFEDYLHLPGLRTFVIGAMLLVISGFGIWWLAIIWAWGG